MNLLSSIKSFKYAIKGLRFVIRENNMQTHILAIVVVVSAGFYFGLNNYEWLWISSAIFLVLITETINTAIEQLVNLVSPKFNPLAGKVKDLAAASVLLASLYALIIAGFIFLPKFMSF